MNQVQSSYTPYTATTWKCHIETRFNSEGSVNISVQDICIVVYMNIIWLMSRFEDVFGATGSTSGLSRRLWKNPLQTVSMCIYRNTEWHGGLTAPHQHVPSNERLHKQCIMWNFWELMNGLEWLNAAWIYCAATPERHTFLRMLYFESRYLFICVWLLWLITEHFKGVKGLYTLPFTNIRAGTAQKHQDSEFKH